MKIKIRKAKSKDIPSLIKIVRGVKSIEDYYGEYNKNLFLKIINDKSIILLVAEVENKVVGFKEFKIDKTAKRIYGESLAVSKKFQGKGIGKKLFETMEAYAKKNKFKRISMLVRDWNKPMNELAKKKHYKISDKLYLWEKNLK